MIGAEGRPSLTGLKFLCRQTIPAQGILFPESVSYFDDQPVQVSVFVGPYCSRDILSYKETFGTIASFLKDYKPHVLVLCGPFLDIENSLVVSGIIYPDADGDEGGELQ